MKEKRFRLTLRHVVLCNAIRTRARLFVLVTTTVTSLQGQYTQHCSLKTGQTGHSYEYC